jgi:uroporphyrinogen-III synthase
VNGPLAGLTVVVTRPRAQAGTFIELARADGAHCIAAPAIEIEPVAPDAEEQGRAATGAFDWVVFTSANAVQHGLRWLPPTGARLAAIGRATARALEAEGRRVSARPDSASSEGILALDAFAAPRGRRILVVKGRGGRTLLRDELVSRGAEVVSLDVYVRRPTEIDDRTCRELQAALQGGRVDCVVAVTSADVLELFLARLGAERAQTARQNTLLAPAPRVVTAARRLGWDGPIVESATAEDTVMLDALRAHWRESRPNA